MKTLVSTIAALFLLLFVLTTFVPHPAAREEARTAGFTVDQIDTGLQYTFERRFFQSTAIALEFALLYVPAMTRLARRLGGLFTVWTVQSRILACLAIGVA